MNIGTKLYTWFFGNYVGKDSERNKYYSDSKDFTSPNAKRWVIYNGEIEASRVPPHWHAWLHKMTNKPPINYIQKYKWQKKHQPNKTGTVDAYYPNSHPLSKNINENKKQSDYESWKP